MAKVRISDLTAAGALAGTDTFPVVQSGVTKKASLSDVLTAVSPSDVGLLSARPAFASVPTGTLYTATDEEGGTTYVNTGSAWLRVARAAAATAGEELASVAPTANTTGLAVNVANTPFRFTQFTTASFTMPDRPVRVQTSSIVVSGIGGATPLSSFQIRYTNDGWSTSHLAETREGVSANVGIWVETVLPMSAMIAPTNGTAPAVGDTVQVALFTVRTDTTKTQAIIKDVANGVNPWLKVIAG